MRSCLLAPDDPAGADLDVVVVVAPHVAAVLVARPALGGGSSEALDAVPTFHRDVLSSAATSLVQRPGAA